ncbi:hypothetical protein SNEBB_000190 [Seison nebaliae]|nr:hypothetical protein SNEBB_000190 [Seison nebaliae]
MMRELVRLNKPKEIFQSPLHRHVVETMRLNSVTTARTCQNENELQLQLKTYVDFLIASRQLQQLTDRYAKGELSVEKAAERVGLHLPKLYKENNNPLSSNSTTSTPSNKEQ